ncbi:MAG TPA: hypothetical protein VGP96_06690 [Candidatus Dormibacteraeota bacterium]|nr:hypothetical protein [Candidatus Dormibacteraeota bacterium]
MNNGHGTEDAVLSIIDHWWRTGPANQPPLMAAQITLRMLPRFPVTSDASLLVPQVVGTIRDLARRGRIRAVTDGSAVLSYSPPLLSHNGDGRR